MSSVLVKDKKGHWSNRIGSKESFDPKIGPKGSSWKLTYRTWVEGGSELYEAFIADYRVGLTAFEAFQKAKWQCEPKPAFHEVACEQMESYPFAKTKVSNGNKKKRPSTPPGPL